MTRPPDNRRNPNEQSWRDSGLHTFGSERFDNLYRNISKLRCNLRVKYEDFRILWGRQELNRYKSLYSSLPGGNSRMCSYCGQEVETELHLYVECHEPYRRVHVASTKLTISSIVTRDIAFTSTAKSCTFRVLSTSQPWSDMN